MTTPKIKSFTHDDLDGLGCGIILKAMFPGRVDSYYCSYNNVNEQVERHIDKGYWKNYDMLVMTDISVTEEVAERIQKELVEEGHKVYLIDHHKTVNWLNKYEWATVKTADENGTLTSGTSLLVPFIQDTLHTPVPANVKDFAEIVRRYDTWDWFNVHDQQALPKELNDYLYMKGRKNFEEKMLEWIPLQEPGKPSYFDEAAREQVDEKQQEIKNYIDKKDKQMIFLTDDIAFVFAELHLSELGNELCLRHPELKYIIMLDAGQGKMSLRATGNQDVSEVAKALGGGGHAKAAGAPIPAEFIRHFVETVMAPAIGSTD